MPASRRRGERWRETLDQIRERGGSLEITLDRRKQSEGFRSDPGETVRTPTPDLLWRVRVRQSGDDRILVEHPAALGRTIEISQGQRLVCVMSVGQNRWLFTSTVRSVTPGRDGVLELDPPDRVERATRRAQARVPTNQLSLPQVRCWQLRDPITAVPAETACRDRISELLAMPPASRPELTDDESTAEGIVEDDHGRRGRVRASLTGKEEPGPRADEQEERGDTHQEQQDLTQADLARVLTLGTLEVPQGGEAEAPGPMSVEEVEVERHPDRKPGE